MTGDFGLRGGVAGFEGRDRALYVGGGGGGNCYMGGGLDAGFCYGVAESFGM